MTSKPFDVVGVGLNAVDFLCLVPEYPRYKEKARMKAFSKQPGGQIATAMVALRRLGLKTRYIGKVGDDDLGRFSLQELEREGVDISCAVVQKGAISQFAFIAIDEERGERTIIWHREPAADLKPQDFCREDVTAGSILHIDGHEFEAALQAARWAKEDGMKVLLDAEEACPGMEKLVELTDILIANEEFPAKFAKGMTLESALKKIESMGPKVVVATLGAKGAAACHGGSILFSPGFKVKAVDTTGAGDIFHAGFIYSTVQGWDLERSLRFSNAFAALKCTKLGGRPGIASLQELEEFMQECR